jgi:dipeptidyl aminopeptidase/acylaminoacyl peptidase
MPPSVRGVRVRFRATDRRRVTGILTRAGKDAPALVLIHQLDGGADQWDDFVPYLHQAGFSTLAYEGRGGLDERELVKEAEGAVAFLERRNDVDRTRLGIVGASIGANTAALALARDRGRRVRAGVALSPGTPSVIDRLQAAGRYNPRRVLILADPDEFPAARRFARGAVASRAVKSANYGHGVNLLGYDDDRAQVMRWLSDQLR